MKDTFDIESWRQALVGALTELQADVARFLPNLVGAIVLLAVGWIVSKIVEAVARRVLRKVGLNQVSSRTRIDAALLRAGFKADLSTTLALILFWTLMLIFVLSAVKALGITEVTSTIDRLIGFLPNVLASGLILVLGLVIARLARNVVSSGAAAANVPRAQRIGAVAGGLIVLLVMVLALEQLGIETALLVTVLTVLVGAVSLTLGLSFALGARPVVTHILAGHFLRQSLLPGSNVEVQGKKARVERVGPLETLVGDGACSWSIPNAALMEESILRRESQPPGRGAEA